MYNRNRKCIEPYCNNTCTRYIINIHTLLCIENITNDQEKEHSANKRKLKNFINQGSHSFWGKKSQNHKNSRPILTHFGGKCQTQNLFDEFTHQRYLQLCLIDSMTLLLEFRKVAAAGNCRS